MCLVLEKIRLDNETQTRRSIREDRTDFVLIGEPRAHEGHVCGTSEDACICGCLHEHQSGHDRNHGRQMLILVATAGEVIGDVEGCVRGALNPRGEGSV